MTHGRSICLENARLACTVEVPDHEWSFGLVAKIFACHFVSQLRSNEEHENTKPCFFCPAGSMGSTVSSMPGHSLSVAAVKLGCGDGTKGAKHRPTSPISLGFSHLEELKNSLHPLGGPVSQLKHYTNLLEGSLYWSLYGDGHWKSRCLSFSRLQWFTNATHRDMCAIFGIY